MDGAAACRAVQVRNVEELRRLPQCLPSAKRVPPTPARPRKVRTMPTGPLRIAPGAARDLGLDPLFGARRKKCDLCQRFRPVPSFCRNRLRRREAVQPPIMYREPAEVAHHHLKNSLFRPLSLCSGRPCAQRRDLASQRGQARYQQCQTAARRQSPRLDVVAFQRAEIGNTVSPAMRIRRVFRRHSRSDACGSYWRATLSSISARMVRPDPSLRGCLRSHNHTVRKRGFGGCLYQLRRHEFLDPTMPALERPRQRDGAAWAGARGASRDARVAWVCRRCSALPSRGHVRP